MDLPGVTPARSGPARSGDGDLDSLLDRQHGVLSLSQALEWWAPQHVKEQVRARRWHRIHSRVLVTHNGPLTRTQHLWVAVLAPPGGGLLYGATAAAQDGLRGFTDEGVHVVLPAGQRRLRVAGVETHWSTKLGPQDVHPLRMPPRTRLPRSLLDLAADQDSERAARAVLMAGVQQRLVRVADLSAALPRRGPCRHRGVLVETCGDLAGGIHSVPEKDFDRIVVARRLPRPTRQAIRRRRDGRYYLDALWERYATSVEIDGVPHFEVVQWDDDLDRASEVMADGLRMLRFTSFSVRHRPCRVGDLLDRSLRTGGWRG